jgi:hypothetical protein
VITVEISCISQNFSNPLYPFAFYEAQKVTRLVEDISSTDLIRLEFQLDTFLDDVRRDNRFKCMYYLGELSILLIETKQKQVIYDLVYLLNCCSCRWRGRTLKEFYFFATSLVKTKLENSVLDELLNHCLVKFMKRYTFLKENEDDIVKILMGMQNHRITKSY